MFRTKVLVGMLAAALVSGFAGTADAGSIFLTGHDPDFHAVLGGNAVGAQNINIAAINFVRATPFNAFNTGSTKILFVESNIAPPSGHIDGELGLIASGFAGQYERHGATTGLLAELALLGTKYDSIVIASDFGGILTQAELNILNANSASIISFLNSGGGLYAMAEGNSGAGLTPGGGWFGYLPFIVTSLNTNQSEVGFQVTAFGASLGLTNNDINGNASHNVFTGTGGMSVVNVDASGAIMSLATRSQITTGGVVVPVPAAAWGGLSLLAGLGVARLARRKRIS